MSVWMLLVAYCFSVGAAAYAVLSCHCMGQEKGEVHIDGHVDSLIYSNSQKLPKNPEKGFGRLFR